LDKNRISSDQITQFKNFTHFIKKQLKTKNNHKIKNKTQILFSCWGNETKDKNPFFLKNSKQLPLFLLLTETKTKKGDIYLAEWILKMQRMEVESNGYANLKQKLNLFFQLS
jgi:hypothetical protein